MIDDKGSLGFRGARGVAEYFGLSERTVRMKATTREWPSYCVGGRRLFDLDELVRLVKEERAGKEQINDRSSSAGGAAGSPSVI